MIGPAADPKAYKLFHNGIQILSKVEEAGMRVDTEYLDKAILETKAEIISLEERLMKHKYWRKWKQTFKDKTNLGSKQQFIQVLADLGLVKIHKTEKGNIKSDRASFDTVQDEFALNYNRMQRLIKADSTYLKGIHREVVDGYIHPIFDLHIPVTYRGSSSNPNLYNIPKRDEEICGLVRRAFIPRKNHVILELDFKGIEVGISCCYHKDPNLIAYVKDPTLDMHRDTGGQIFMCEKDQVSKDMRFVAKNSFVFAEFYGSVYQQCAVNLWGEIERGKLTLADGTPIQKHLKQKGIKDRGDCSFDSQPKQATFEAHLKSVEQSFWNKRFKKYAKWKNKLWEEYLEHGYVKFHTGFIVRGLYKRNEIINSPIQGSAFHCLLWCEMQLVKWLIKNKMKTKIVNQVYDSLICDVHKKELDDFLSHAKYLMEERVMKHWEWIIVPLTVDCEIGEKNWFEMAPHK